MKEGAVGFDIAYVAAKQIKSRLIEPYEQYRRDINAARADVFLSLARALHRPPEALLERV